MHEAQFYDEASFLTLTYSETNLPQTGSLDVPEYQRFFKRLRRARPGKRLRYFGCGEYGDRTQRPHYHAIVFGEAFRGDRKRWKRGKRGDEIYVSAELDSIWKLGACYIGEVTIDSAGYVARYAIKKVNGDRADAHYQGRTPEFMTCSNGLSQRWFDLYSDDLYSGDFAVFKGKRMRVPRAYDRKLPEDLLEEIKAKRILRAEQNAWNNTPERLAVREEVTRARTTNLQRNDE